MDNKFLLFRKSILAGVFISLGCIANLKVGGYLGAFLFSFGLLSVVLYSVPLFTGKAGFCTTKGDIKNLPFILIGNLVGVAILAFCSYFCFPDLIPKAQKIVSLRMQASWGSAMWASVLCGFVMTTIVQFARKQENHVLDSARKQDLSLKQEGTRNFLILLLGIPLFILSGYWHCIADAFYYSVSGIFTPSLLLVYSLTVIGNYLGCNLYNLIVNSSLLFSDE